MPTPSAADEGSSHAHLFRRTAHVRCAHAVIIAATPKSAPAVKVIILTSCQRLNNRSALVACLTTRSVRSSNRLMDTAPHELPPSGRAVWIAMRPRHVHEGKLLSSSTDGMAQGRIDSIEQAIRLGMVQGERTDAIVRRIRGTQLCR